VIRALAGTARGHSLLAPLAAGATSGSLFAASLWIPPLGFLLSLASPLPVAIEAWRRGNGAAGIAVFAGALASWVLGGPVGATVYVSQFAAAGFALGVAARSGLSPTWVVGSYVAVAMAAFGVSLAWLASGSGLGLEGFLDQTLTDTLDRAVQQLLQGDLDAQTTLAVQTWAEQTRKVMLLTFPGLYGVLALFAGWGNALALRRVVGADGPWHTWNAPESWIWVLIGSGLLGVVAPAPWGTAALNLFLVVAAVYFLQGLAIVQNLFETRNVPRMFRVGAYILLFVQLPVMLLVAGVGAFDLWFDFRSRWKPPADDAGPPDTQT
jgi:uncharacterized protein YybS (DUF2232 family)